MVSDYEPEYEHCHDYECDGWHNLVNTEAGRARLMDYERRVNNVVQIGWLKNPPPPPTKKEQRREAIALVLVTIGLITITLLPVWVTVLLRH